MNQFSPMSQDTTPRPHQRFFGAAAQHPTFTQSAPVQPEQPEHVDFQANPLPEAPVAPAQNDQTPPAITPIHDHAHKEPSGPEHHSVAPTPAPIDTPAPVDAPTQIETPIDAPKEHHDNSEIKAIIDEMKKLGEKEYGVDEIKNKVIEQLNNILKEMRADRNKFTELEDKYDDICIKTGEIFNPYFESARDNKYKLNAKMSGVREILTNFTQM